MSFVFAAVSVGLGAASAAGAFTPSVNYPNLGASSAEMANVEAELLPELLRMQAGAQEGQQVLNQGYTQQTLSAEQAAQQRASIQAQIQQVQNQLNPPDQINSQESGHKRGEGGNQPLSGEQTKQLQDKLTQLRQQLNGIPQNGGLVYFDKNGIPVSASQAIGIPAGHGTADIQGQIMRQLAEGQLSNAEKFDPQFIASALAQEQQANPQGVAARQQLYNLIQNPPTPQSPVADEMQRQVTGRVNAGSGLTPEEQSMLDATVNKSITGTSGATPDYSKLLTTGFGGQARLASNAGAGASWLASGETPEDINYRQQQQNLENLYNYIQGKTPQSQFSSLSGAQNGPTPQTSTNYYPQADFGAGNLGAEAAITNYGQNVNQTLSQVNPWTAGISGVLNAGSTLAGFMG